VKKVMTQDEKWTKAILQETPDSPGVYSYSNTDGAKFRSEDADFWNNEAANLLKDTYEKLGISFDTDINS
jgi:hypothetical protein